MTDMTTLSVLAELHKQPRSVSSDFARAAAPEVAALASQGLITTRLPQRKPVYGRVWRVTLGGVQALVKDGYL